MQGCAIELDACWRHPVLDAGRLPEELYEMHLHAVSGGGGAGGKHLFMDFCSPWWRVASLMLTPLCICIRMHGF